MVSCYTLFSLAAAAAACWTDELIAMTPQNLMVENHEREID